MDKNRIKGAMKQAEGKAKSATGNLIGSPKLVLDGKVDTAKGKVQSAVGQLKDAIKK